MLLYIAEPCSLQLLGGEGLGALWGCSRRCCRSIIGTRINGIDHDAWSRTRWTWAANTRSGWRNSGRCKWSGLLRGSWLRNYGLRSG